MNGQKPQQNEYPLRVFLIPYFAMVLFLLLPELNTARLACNYKYN